MGSAACSLRHADGGVRPAEGARGVQPTANQHKEAPPLLAARASARGPLSAVGLCASTLENSQPSRKQLTSNGAWQGPPPLPCLPLLRIEPPPMAGFPLFSCRTAGMGNLVNSGGR